jgi:ABC-2 type transport system permease protein
VVVVAFAVSWLFTTMGLLLRSPNAVQGIGQMGIFLLVFFSNVFVDPDTLPGALQAVVDANPISHVVTAVRGLAAGHGSAREIGLVLGEAAALTAVFATLTTRLYRRG